MHIAHTDTRLLQISCQILCHFFRQRRDEHALLPRDHGVAFADQIVDLPLDGTHVDPRIKQTGRADDLLDNLPGALALELCRSRRDIDGLPDLALELREGQRPVVERARQAEAVIDQALLAAAVAGVHRAHLRQCDVALVDKEQKILREIVQQRHRRRARRAAGNHAGIVLDAAAKANFL